MNLIRIKRKGAKNYRKRAGRREKEREDREKIKQ